MYTNNAQSNNLQGPLLYRWLGHNDLYLIKDMTTQCLTRLKSLSQFRLQIPNYSRIKFLKHILGLFSLPQNFSDKKWISSELDVDRKGDRKWTESKPKIKGVYRGFGTFSHFLIFGLTVELGTSPYIIK